MTHYGDPGTGHMVSGTTEILPTGSQPIFVYAQPQAGRSWGRRLLVFIGVMALVAALFFAAALAFGIKTVTDFIRDPFTSQTTDRSSPVLLQSLQDMSRYVAAEGNFQVVIDQEESKKYLPNILYSERSLFLGIGSVDAYVDFSAVNEDSIVISEDGKSVTITLPPPKLTEASIDVEHSKVLDYDRGLFNWLRDIFADDPNKQQQLYVLAQKKIGEAAESSELRNRAEVNTRTMLESLLKGLGFERVTVNFATAPRP